MASMRAGMGREAACVRDPSPEHVGQGLGKVAGLFSPTLSSSSLPLNLLVELVFVTDSGLVSAFKARTIPFSPQISVFSFYLNCSDRGEMMTAIRMRWGGLVRCKTKVGDSIINRLTWRSEKNNILWLCFIYSSSLNSF